MRPAGAVPTNDWWSSLVFKKLNCQYSEILQAHPAAYLPNAGGLGFSYSTTPEFVIPAPGLQEYHYPYHQDFTAGVSGLSAPIVKVDNWSDWTVTPSWVDGSRSMTATIGHGLPMTYFKVAGGGAQLTLDANANCLAQRRRHCWIHGERPRLRRLCADRRGMGGVRFIDRLESWRQGLLHRGGVADHRCQFGQ